MSEEILGRYRLTRKLATGGMAEIWLATIEGPERFQKRVVVKKILPNLAEDEEFVRMFLDEARIAARLNHPNIAQIFDLGEVDGAYYIAMEYIPGKDLRRVYQDSVKAERTLPIPLAVRILIESAQALDYAHAATDASGRALQIVHRDVSPQNVLVTFQGGVKLVDFGIAKAADQASATRAGVLKGKYSYMSPEQAAGDPVDSRTDIFALGIVGYELATGFRLFKRENEVATLQAVRDCDVPAPSSVAPQVPRSLDRVLLKALAKDPGERYRTAGQLALALEEFLLLGQYPASGTHLAEFMRGLYPDGGEPMELSEPAPPPKRDGSNPSSSSRRAPVHGAGLTPRPTGTRSARMIAAPRPPVPAKPPPPIAPTARLQAPARPKPPAPAPERSLVSEPSAPAEAAEAEQAEPRSRPARPPERPPATVPEPEPSRPREARPLPSEDADDDRPGRPRARRAVGALVAVALFAGLAVLGRPVIGALGPMLSTALAAKSGSTDGGRCFLCGLGSPTEGRLTLVTNPPSVVFLGTESLGSTPLVEVSVPAGHVALRVVNESAALDTTLGVDVQANQVTSLEKTFPIGSVTVPMAKGHSYQVFFQGKPLGRVPGPPLEMVEGDHALTLVDDRTGEHVERSVSVRAGRKTAR
ncbi:MAG: serine/threonine-protein kinase [Deltaproteobacteria bacterium]